VYGNGLNVRDWLHVDDHCRGIAIVLEKGLSGEIYNIGGGTEISKIELTKLLVEPFGKFEDFVEYVEDRKGHDLRYSVNWDKISTIGYRPIVDFQTGIANAIKWYQGTR